MSTASFDWGLRWGLINEQEHADLERWLREFYDMIRDDCRSIKLRYNGFDAVGELKEPQNHGAMQNNFVHYFTTGFRDRMKSRYFFMTERELRELREILDVVLQKGLICSPDPGPDQALDSCVRIGTREGACESSGNT